MNSKFYFRTVSKSWQGKLVMRKYVKKLCSNCEWNKTESIILPNIKLEKSSSTMDRLHLFENATVKF